MSGAELLAKWPPARVRSTAYSSLERRRQRMALLAERLYAVALHEGTRKHLDLAYEYFDLASELYRAGANR